MPKNALPYLDFPGPLAFAHRGAGPVEEENTGPAIQEAVRLGYVHVETDVQASSDGVAVLFHDIGLGRIFDSDRSVADLTWAELKGLRSGAGASPVRLDEMLDAFPDTRFNIDAKTWGAVEPMAEAIARAGAQDRVCISSFSVRRTKAVLARLGGEVAWSPSRVGVAHLVFSAFHVPLPRPKFPAVQVPLAFGPIPIVSRTMLRKAHSLGQQVHVWTINDADEMNRLLDLGVDGIMTDHAEVLKKVLQGRGDWHGTA